MKLRRTIWTGRSWIHGPMVPLSYCLIAILLCNIAIAVTPDVMETWETGASEGWTREDYLNAYTFSMGSSVDYLQVVFNQKTRPFPEQHIITAGSGALGGGFVGDYVAAGVTNVSFKLYCESHIPGDLRIYLFCAGSGRWWNYKLEPPKIGEWTTYNVPIAYSEKWRIPEPGSTRKFNEDLKTVGWIGIQLQRNISLAKQVYGIDDFVLDSNGKFVPAWWVAQNVSAEADPAASDSDGDGVDNYSEYRAGTDPNDEESVFEMGIAEAEEAEQSAGFVLRWNSAPNRSYTVWRATDLTEGFSVIETGIPGTPPVNSYEDMTATSNGSYFYRVEVE